MPSSNDKKCSKCSEIKELEAFYINQNYCKACVSIHNKQYSKKNKAAVNTKNTKWKSKRATENKVLIKQYVGDYECTHCGFTSEYDEVFDWHHKEKETKEFSIGNGYRKSWEELKNEIDKCILLCSNCHRILHAKERDES